MSGVEKLANAEAQKNAGKKGDAMKQYEADYKKAASTTVPVKK